MKNSRIILAILLISVSTGIFVRAQNSAELKVVKVYFHFIGTEGTESKILPLKRKVSRQAPLFPAIDELLKVPTAEEQKLGYHSADRHPE